MEWLRQFGRRAPHLFGALSAVYGRWVSLSPRKKRLLKFLTSTLPFEYKVATPDDSELLAGMAAQLTPEDLRFFAPHPLDSSGFRQVLRNGATVGIIDSGYTFVRLFGKSAWIGYMVPPGERGRGKAKEGIAILNRACRAAGYTVRATVHKENPVSLRVASPATVTRDLGDRWELRLLSPDGTDVPS